MNQSWWNHVSVQIHGNDNTVVVEDDALLENVKIVVWGNNSTIHIGKNCRVKGVQLTIEDNGNAVEIGADTTFQGGVQFAVIEGTKIEIGNDCMFSSNICLRTGDSHSVIDLSGNRTNQSESIRIGSHVWVGEGATCLKGTEIKDNSIIANRALCSRKYEESNVIVAGFPAKIVRRNVGWLRKRI